MPCYNSLAADRHADEQGREAALDTLVEIETEILLENFDQGMNDPLLEADDVIDDLLAGPHIQRLIKAAWMAGTYRELGEDIHRELNDIARRRALSTRDTLRARLERDTDARGRYREIP